MKSASKSRVGLEANIVVLRIIVPICLQNAASSHAYLSLPGAIACLLAGLTKNRFNATLPYEKPNFPLSIQRMSSSDQKSIAMLFKT